MIGGIIVGHLFLSTLSTNLVLGIQENSAVAQLASDRIESSIAGANTTAAQNTPELQLLAAAGTVSREKSISAGIEINNLEQSR